jgi:hypothetical protein
MGRFSNFNTLTVLVLEVFGVHIPIRLIYIIYALLFFNRNEIFIKLVEGTHAGARAFQNI